MFGDEKKYEKFEMKPLVGKTWDYSKRDNWMYFPDNDILKQDVDTFFLYPTSVLPDVKTEVCEDKQYMGENARRSYLQSADAFSSFTNMYAPYYRQLSAVALMNNSTADEFMEAMCELYP